MNTIIRESGGAEKSDWSRYLVIGESNFIFFYANIIVRETFMSELQKKQSKYFNQLSLLATLDWPLTIYHHKTNVMYQPINLSYIFTILVFSNSPCKICIQYEAEDVWFSCKTKQNVKIELMIS